MNNADLRERASEYISKTEKVLKNLKVESSPSFINTDLMIEVINEAKRYFEDAKYYFRREKYDVSLASIAYCEGLLDALRIMKLVKFEW
jgi:FAD synthetase